MNNHALWLAAAFMLMFEGLLPLLAPGLWRQVFEKMLQMPEKNIRVYGAISVVAGVALYWVVASLG